MRPSWWPPLIFKTFGGGRFGHPRSLQGGEKVPSWLLRARGRPQNRSTAFLQWIMAPWALPPCKNAVNLAVARGIVNMQSIGLAAIYGAPSGDLEASKQFFKKASQLRTFFLGAFCPHSRWARHPVKMQGFELATLFVAPSDFQNFCERDPRKLVVVFCAFIEVATGPCKNEGIRAGGHFGGPL